MKVEGYELTEKIGEGGMSTVYKGRQVSLNRPVAIKFLLENLQQHSDVMDLFNRESMLVARLLHPNIIHIIDRGITEDGTPYFVMEYVEGKELVDYIKKGSLSFAEKVDLMLQMCRGLAFAHKSGVVHRDIKPSNVLVDVQGHARILDFGIAHFTGDDTQLAESNYNRVAGTYRYMAPEQRKTVDVDQRADIYSLGVLMHELFTNRIPASLKRRPIELNPEIPPALDELILKCLAEDPADRPQSADAVRDRLLKLSQGSHLKSGMRKRAVSGLDQLKRNYVLLDVISEGRQGSSYLYQDKKSGRLVIVKRRPSHHGGFREAKLLMNFRHSNIARVYGAAGDDQTFFVMMEYLPGNSLDSRIAKPYALKDFIGVAMQVCQGLAYAHQHRIIHGSLRPSNIMFTEDGIVKLTDFGFESATTDYVADWYKPPTSRPRNHLLDIFSAGAVFYHMLVGAPIQWTKGEPLHPLAFYMLPEELRALLMDMLGGAYNPRIQSVQQVMEMLEKLEPMLLKVKDDEKSRLLTSIKIPDEPIEYMNHSQATEVDWKRVGKWVGVAVILGTVGGVSMLYPQWPYVLHDYLVQGWDWVAENALVLWQESLPWRLEMLSYWHQFVDWARGLLK